LEAVATILSAVKVIAFSIKSLTSISQDNTGVNRESRKGIGQSIHKWILIGGALVGTLTIAYLESIVNSKPKRDVGEEKHVERTESIYVAE